MNKAATSWHAELMAHQLDALEDAIRQDLAALEKHRGKLFTGAPKQLRLLDLTAGLEAVAAARTALARCPAGAELAFHVLEAASSRTRVDAEIGRGVTKGGNATKVKKARQTLKAHEELRRAAEKLGDLSAVRKAQIIRANGASTLSERQIRKIIPKK